MFNLPIVQRELLIASKRLGSWLWRWIIAVIAVSFAGFWLLAGSGAGQNGPVSLQGDIFFMVMTWSCFIYCLLAGLWTTTDTLTREKNDGTLGLLFLTNLRGYDVVLGKMCSGSLRSFYGVLAVLPVLALPLLMGGVTNAQFWRTVFALLNILIFSLSCGIFFSAICRRTFQSIFYTLLFLVSITLAPLIYVWMGGVNEALSLASPAIAMYRAYAPQIGPALPGFGWYPLWVGAGLFASICFLVCASWIVPKSWQYDGFKILKESIRILKKAIRVFLCAFSILAPSFDDFIYRLVKFYRYFLSTNRRISSFRRTLYLDSNPISWLVIRNASMRQSRVFLILYLALAWMAITVYSSLNGRVEPAIIITGTSLLWLGSLWFRIDLTRHTVSSISEAKECGALEQILVTPMNERQFRRGHFRAMASFWLWPLISLLLAPILYILIQALMHPEILEESGLVFGITFIGVLIVGLPLLSFFLDIFALYFSGCWFALRNHSFGQAFWKTFGFVYLLPTIGSIFVCFIGQFAWLITGTIFIIWPLTSLQGNFRRVVSGEYGLSHVKKPLST